MANGCMKVTFYSLWPVPGGSVVTVGTLNARQRPGGPYTETAPCGAGCGRANLRWSAVNGDGPGSFGGDVPLEQLDALHELILVSPGDGNLILIDSNDELESVNVGDSVDVDHEIPADANEIFLGQLQEQIL